MLLLQVTRSGLLLFTTVTFDKQHTGLKKAFSNPKSLLLNGHFQEKALVTGWWGQMVVMNKVKRKCTIVAALSSKRVAE